jgi:hypothetical protein
MQLTKSQLRRIVQEAVKQKLDEGPLSNSASGFVASLQDQDREILHSLVSECWGSQLSDLQRILPPEMQHVVDAFDAMCSDLMEELERS